MTTIASGADILIPVNALVVLGEFCRVIMLVTLDTTEECKIARHCVTFDALIPFAIMITAVNWEVLLVVIPGRRIPGVCVMAILARRRKLSGYVIRVVGRVVI